MPQYLLYVPERPQNSEFCMT